MSVRGCSAAHASVERACVAFRALCLQRTPCCILTPKTVMYVFLIIATDGFARRGNNLLEPAASGSEIWQPGKQSGAGGSVALRLANCPIARAPGTPGLGARSGVQSANPLIASLARSATAARRRPFRMEPDVACLVIFAFRSVNCDSHLHSRIAPIAKRMSYRMQSSLECRDVDSGFYSCTPKLDSLRPNPKGL